MKLNLVLAAATTLLACAAADPVGPAATLRFAASVSPASSYQSSAGAAPSLVVEPELAPAAAPASAIPVQEEALNFVELADSPGDDRLEPAATLIKAGQWFKARLTLSKVLPRLDADGSLDVKLAAHALLARACAMQADVKCAQREYQLVRTMWHEAEAGREWSAALEGAQDSKRARLARALMAVAEAWFHAGEEKRLAADKELFPVYRGKGDKESVFKHINTKTASWLRARRELLKEAEEAYLGVARLQPSPPPYWIIASSSRVGRMWNKFVLEFRGAPIPKEWAGVGPLPGSTLEREELRNTYYAAIDEASEPYRDRARGAFEVCHDHAKKTSTFNDYSSECDHWLEKHAKPTAEPPLAAVP